MEAHAEELAHQGVVVASFRRRGGRVVGPYYRLTFRDGRRQRSLYLGNDVELVAEVRAALREIQTPWQERRAVRQHKKTIRKALAQCKVELRRELRRRGLRLQGYEVRGWQTPGPRAVAVDRDQRGQGQSQGGLPAPAPEGRPIVRPEHGVDAVMG